MEVSQIFNFGLVARVRAIIVREQVMNMVTVRAVVPIRRDESRMNSLFKSVEFF